MKIQGLSLYFKSIKKSDPNILTFEEIDKQLKIWLNKNIMHIFKKRNLFTFTEQQWKDILTIIKYSISKKDIKKWYKKYGKDYCETLKNNYSTFFLITKDGS